MEGSSHKKWAMILGITTIIFAGLWINEIRKPSGIEEFKADLVELQAEVDTACADTTTPAGQEACTDALESLQSFLGQLQG